MQRSRLVVGWPWNSPFSFTQCMESMLQLRHPEGWDTTFVRGTGHSSARRHIDICEKALRLGADLICIVGSDQVYQPDMLCRLVARFQEGYEVVAAMVPTRGFLPFQGMQPFEPMAWRMKTLTELSPDGKPSKREFRTLADDADMVHRIKPTDGGMQRVDFVGSGVVLFHRDHLLALTPPWFYETIQIETQARIANMDCRWIMRLKTEADAQVWIDTTLKVTHLHIFEIDESFPGRFADWANQDATPDPAITQYRNPAELGNFMQTNGKPMGGQKSYQEWQQHVTTLGENEGKA